MYRLEHVRFAYPGNPLLDIAYFEIAPGSITAITGANGSGKTTLLNLLAMLQLPGAGQLQFKNHTVNRGNVDELRQNIGYVQQKPYLLRLTVRENIELGLRFRGVATAARQERSNAIMERLGIAALAGRKAHGLSGGEAQKVGIARALVVDPEILILDEPFSHLDVQAVAFFEALLAELRQEQEKTVVFTSHDPVTAQLLADSIYSMVNGDLVPSDMTNLYHGEVRAADHCFITGKLEIHIPEAIRTGSHLTIDPGALVLSRDKLHSSMRNQFRGRIAAVQEKHTQIQLGIEAGERFQAIITPAALQDLDLQFGDTVWVSFKSSAVHVF
ncbi:MAG: ATP-binding cassette domain-containing protein [Thiotrichales bacterium]|nr:ATP-binding cassette domain-containing protein [Thiotrichales bacterium]